MSGKTANLDSEALAVAYRNGTSAYRLAKNNDVSIWSIITRLRKAGVVMRKDGVPKTLNLSTNAGARFVEIVDGLLLGDGSINPHHRRCFIRLEQAVRRIGFLEQAHGLLAEIGVPSRIIPLRQQKTRQPKMIEGREIHPGPSALLYTPVTEEMRFQRHRWYSDGRFKTVPADIKLSPLTAALWFSGDGTSSGACGLVICTQGFSSGDVDYLISCLQRDLDVIATKRPARKDGQFTVALGDRNEALRFRDLILPHMPECCLYKLRFLREKRAPGRISFARTLRESMS